jgi:asparagine synthase (glutamine-hydrolysing)
MDFVILPDCAAATELASDLPGPQRIDHASGRPWIVGDWAAGEVTLVEAGPRRLACLGLTRVDAAATARSLAGLGSLHDADVIAASLPGACHLSVSMDGRVRAQGTVCGSRQIFFAQAGGLGVAASNVAPLRRLTGAQIDETLLAGRLLAPAGPPWPVSQRPIWRGIEALEAGHWLLLDAHGRPVQKRWWKPPEASAPLPVAAQAVRAALAEAVALRAAGTISADLSGGLDSTCLCFLAAAAGADLVTYHAVPLDRANQDTVWAREAATFLPAARHRVLPVEREENWFNVGYTPDARDVDPEGPGNWADGLPHVRDLTGRALAEGASIHLMGLGGDELFGPMPAYPWSFVRAHPIAGLRTLNRHRLGSRWTLGATVRALADRSTFGQDLAAVADRITEAPSAVPGIDCGWTPAVYMPPWATREAVQTVRALLRDAASSAPGPLDRDRTRHQVLTSLIFEGSTMRQIDTVTAGSGLRWEAPFLDDRVIEAALSVRIGERMVSGRFKPLLTEAMRATVPERLLGRRDKGEFSAEGFKGLRHNRERLAGLSQQSRLAELGLIDPAAFRAALLSPGVMSHHFQQLATTVACEGWLRTHSWSVAAPAGGRT